MVAAAATTAAATGASTVAGSMAAGLVAGEAADGEVAGVTAVEVRRVEPTETGKRQAVASARVDVVCIDVDDEAAAHSGAPSRASADAPYRAHAGVQCEGLCAGGRRCGVWSVGSSAPQWVSAPLRTGARFCTTHEPRRSAARAAQAAERASAKAARMRQPVRGVQRAGAVRRAAAANSSTAGMAAAIMAARRE